MEKNVRNQKEPGVTWDCVGWLLTTQAKEVAVTPVMTTSWSCKPKSYC